MTGKYVPVIGKRVEGFMIVDGEGRLRANALFSDTEGAINYIHAVWPESVNNGEAPYGLRVKHVVVTFDD